MWDYTYEDETAGHKERHAGDVDSDIGLEAGDPHFNQHWLSYRYFIDGWNRADGGSGGCIYGMGAGCVVFSGENAPARDGMRRTRKSGSNQYAVFFFLVCVYMRMRIWSWFEGHVRRRGSSSNRK